VFWKGCSHDADRVDPEGGELTISCGAALFNLRVALRHWGYRDDQNRASARSRRCGFARSRPPGRGGPPSPEDEALFEAIPRRRMA
jgi:hypothetical protein